MKRLILADNQAIFRAGAARVLTMEDDIRIVAQCDDPVRLIAAMAVARGAIAVVSSGLSPGPVAIAKEAQALECRLILIAENNEQVSDEASERADGIICRNVAGPDLVDCVRKVARGQRYLQRANVTTMQPVDAVGTRVRDRLTPKEMQIVALIVQGCKNKDIANQLGTKEQVIKNYLRSVYDKTGVSDRLELALFTIHHRVLAEAAAKAGNLLQMKSA
jgi:DNA-binding NarL/FixJ family response regulator